LLNIKVNDHRPKFQTEQRFFPIVQLEIAFKINIATKTAVIANPKICVACRFASSSFFSHCGLSFASMVASSAEPLGGYDKESRQNQCTLRRRGYPKVSGAKGNGGHAPDSLSLGVQSRVVARSLGVAEGNGIAAILPLTLTCRRSGLLQVRKFDGVSFRFPVAGFHIALWCIHVRNSDSTGIYFIVAFVLRGRLFFSKALRYVWGLRRSGI
jgi:hypothetical protein